MASSTFMLKDMVLGYSPLFAAKISLTDALSGLLLSMLSQQRESHLGNFLYEVEIATSRLCAC